MGASSETTPSTATTTATTASRTRCRPRTLSWCPHPVWQPTGPGEEELIRTTACGAAAPPLWSALTGAALKADKEELQYILAAHRSSCSLQVKVEPATEEESPVFVEVQPSVETVKPQRPGSLSLIPVNNIE